MSFAAPFAIYAFVFVFGNCTGILNNGKSGNQPWFLLPNGVTDTTPGVDDGGSGSSGAAGSGLPVTGMYFLHPDHLGSITMITGASGKPITGAGGQSRITYSPYGSIDRPHSGGPDISKHKFTGQEEDSESGLMYYKARYYDTVIGAFVSADSMSFPEQEFGMNSYMYVTGNPVTLNDPTGHCPAKENYWVWGNYTGPGACGSRLPNWWKGDLLLWYFLSTGKSKEALAWYLYNQNDNPSGVKPPLSEQDQISQDHDVEFKGFDKLDQQQSTAANEKYMSRSWGKYTSGTYYKKTYEREMDAVPDWYGDAKPLVGGINTIGTMLDDWLVTLISTAIFGTWNYYAYHVQAYNKVTHIDKDRYKFKRNKQEILIYKTKLPPYGTPFKISTTIPKMNMNLMPNKNQTKNLTKPDKWKL